MWRAVCRGCGSDLGSRGQSFARARWRWLVPASGGLEGSVERELGIGLGVSVDPGVVQVGAGVGGGLVQPWRLVERRGGWRPRR